MPYLPILQAGDIPLQIKAVKLLVFLLGDKIGNNLKGRNSPGISLPYIGRGARLRIIFKADAYFLCGYINGDITTRPGRFTIGHIILNIIVP